jgi:hypothetical protein
MTSSSPMLMDKVIMTGTSSPIPNFCSACKTATTRLPPAIRPHGTCRPMAGRLMS